MIPFRLVMAATLAVVAGASTALAKTVPMRVSHQLPPTHYLSKGIEDWARDIRERSGNTLSVQVFPASQLMTASEHHMSVAQNMMECAINTNFEWGKTIPAMSATLRPFGITDPDMLTKWPGSPAAKLLEELLEQKGVRNVAWFVLANVSAISSNTRPLNAPRDFKGVKIRGLNKFFDSALSAVGAIPVIINGAEVYSALQSGLLDAAITDVSSTVTRRYYETQKYAVLNHINAVFFHAFCSPKWLDGLTQTQRDAIAAASAKAEQRAIAHGLDNLKASTQQLIEKGMTVHTQTPEEESVLRVVMQPAFDKVFRDSAGPRADAILTAIDGLTRR